MGIFNRRINLENKSGFDIDYMFKSPDDETKEIWFYYDVPFYIYMNGVRAYFDAYDVNIDGTDSHIFNSLSNIGAIKELEDDEFFIDFLKEKCKDDAYEEFKEKFEEDREE